jgi:hypothetical protein
MSLLSPLLNEFENLSQLSSGVNEELNRITIEGNALLHDVVDRLIKVVEHVQKLGIISPSIMIGNRNVDVDDLQGTQQLLGKPWRLIMGKSHLAEKLALGHGQRTFIFFNVDRFNKWIADVDPFAQLGRIDEAFCGQTTIRVGGLARGIWGPMLRILGLDEAEPLVSLTTKLPTESIVQANLNVASSHPFRLRPREWEIVGGDFQSLTGIAVLRKAVLVLAACLAQTISIDSSDIRVTLKGSKKVELYLAPAIGDEHEIFLVLVDALGWIYEERTETRLKLLIERLCVELEAGGSLLSGLKFYLFDSLRQARDSYDYVIVDRKDAYHKEMREFMKDMKVQADQFASKVRDLIAALTRDVLGILVLVGFSFIAKFDALNLQKMTNSAEFLLLVKVLAGYLIVSCSLICYISYRDARMGYAELSNWFQILQNYTSSREFKSRVLSPLNARMKYLWIMMGAVGIIYISIAIMVWNLPSILKYALGWR